jgi:type II secretory pathway pseudopilin PulG
MKRKRIGRRSNGFTLLELIVALGMTVVIAGVVASSMYTTFQAKKSAEGAIKQAQEADPVSEMMGRDFAAALPPTGIFAGLFSADAGTVSFYASGGDTRSAVPGDIHKVEYYISVDQAETLVRRVTTNLTPADGAEEPPEELVLRNVKSMELAYFDGTNWADAWDSTAQQDADGLDVLPVAVKVTLEIGMGNGESRKVERIYSLLCGEAVNVGGMIGGGL